MIVVEWANESIQANSPLQMIDSVEYFALS